MQDWKRVEETANDESFPTREAESPAEVASDPLSTVADLSGNATMPTDDPGIDIVEVSSFDLKALRNCRKLRRLRLHFLEPRQHWFEFAKEKDHFQTISTFEFFTICVIDASKRIPIDRCCDYFKALCPELALLGFIESSGHGHSFAEWISPPELEITALLLRDREYDFKQRISLSITVSRSSPN
ncbi:hypothetical protein AVEN_257458-1 [Araneus ventricosus]|uniref:Uncharacterized protein n=1 Tax=Araneus ventricosus TaxID=182803 RepID=A0A4Y2FDQ7_ARAVE|nr:hypothetical protein AVEN_257458-1 [Araneus ventricosus]